MDIIKSFNIRSITLLFLLINQLSFSQDLDCYLVNSGPKLYMQDYKYHRIANDIINNKLNENKEDSLTLIGVSKKELLEDLQYMINNPNTTSLNDSGYYCGVVVVLNWMLNKRPDLYVKGVIDLAYLGETKFKNGSKKVKLPKALINRVNYSIIGTVGKIKRADIGDISLSDFVLGVSLVYSEKVLQRFGLIWKKSTHRKSNVGNFIFSNTMPWEMNDYFKAIGIPKTRKSYYSPFENKDFIIDLITQAVADGELPILMENHILTADRHKNIFYKVFGAHYITIHSFRYNSECNTISMSYWDYGSVKNYREQSEKGSPLAARTLKAAIRQNNRLNKIQKDDRYIEISRELFFKGLKGYWIPNYTAPNN